MKRMAVVTLDGLLAFACPAPAAAQGPVGFSVGPTFAGIRSVAREAGARRLSTGMAVGGTGELRVGAVALAGSYLEGNVRPDGTTTDISFVEGSGALSVRLNSWLEVGTTVRVHRIDEVAPERWLFWGARAAVETPIVGRTLRGRAMYSQGFGGSVNLPYGGVQGQSGEVGLTFQFPERPFILDLATVVEGNEAGGRSRTLQYLLLTVGWSGP
jgi:hypothetical protein